MIFMCGTCGCNKKAESNIEYAANFWESDSFKDWADEEVMEHGDVSFEDWAGQELGESSHQSSGKLTFEDWADHENTELTHSAESLEDYSPEELTTSNVNVGDFMVDAGKGGYGAEEGGKCSCCGNKIVNGSCGCPSDCPHCGGRPLDSETFGAGKGSYGAEFELHDWYDDMSDYGVMEMSPRIQEQKDEYLKELDLQRDAYERSKRVKNPEAMMQRRLSNINRAIGDSPQEFGMGKNYGVATAPEGKGLSGYYNSKVVKYVAIAALGFAGYKVASNR